MARFFCFAACACVNKKANGRDVARSRSRHTVHKKRKQQWLGRLAVGVAGVAAPAAIPTAPLPTVALLFSLQQTRFHVHVLVRSRPSLAIGCDCLRVFISLFNCVYEFRIFAHMKNCSRGTASAPQLCRSQQPHSRND